MLTMKGTCPHCTANLDLTGRFPIPEKIPNAAWARFSCPICLNPIKVRILVTRREDITVLPFTKG